MSVVIKSPVVCVRTIRIVLVSDLKEFEFFPGTEYLAHSWREWGMHIHDREPFDVGGSSICGKCPEKFEAGNRVPTISFHSFILQGQALQAWKQATDL
jgi:hypothetical protein